MRATEYTESTHPRTTPKSFVSPTCPTEWKPIIKCHKTVDGWSGEGNLQGVEGGVSVLSVYSVAIFHPDPVGYLVIDRTWDVGDQRAIRTRFAPERVPDGTTSRNDCGRVVQNTRPSGRCCRRVSETFPTTPPVIDCTPRSGSVISRDRIGPAESSRHQKYQRYGQNQQRNCLGLLFVRHHGAAPKTSLFHHGAIRVPWKFPTSKTFCDNS